MVVQTITLNVGNLQALNAFNDVMYMGFGTGTTTSSQSQTSLVSEVLRVQVPDIVKDNINYEYSFTGRIPISKFNSGTVNEIGLFNASSGGDMACRIVFDTGITKTSDDELIFRIKIKVNTVNN